MKRLRALACAITVLTLCSVQSTDLLQSVTVSAEDLSIVNDSKEVIESGSYSDTIDYTFYSNGELVITGEGKISGKLSTVIENYVNVTSVSIGDGITSIGSGAFVYFKNLRTVTMADTVTVIEDAAFADNPQIQSVTFSNNLETIEPSAFSNCPSLTYINIPESVTSIGNWAFSRCINLKRVIVNNPNCSIGQSAFSNSLGSLIVAPEGSTAQDYAKSYYRTFKPLEEYDEVIVDYGIIPANKYDGIAWFILDNGTLMLSNFVSDNKTGSLVHGNLPSLDKIPDDYLETWNTFRNTITFIVIDKSPSHIGANLFEGFTSLTDIEIACGTIDSYAFKGCSNLVSVNAPNVTTIKEGAFEGCTNLISIDAPRIMKVEKGALNDTKWYEEQLSSGPAIVLNGVLIDCSNYGEEVIVPNGVHAIASNLFSDNETVKSVVLSSTVNELMGVNPFEDSAVESINVSADNEKYCSVDGVLYSKDMKRLITYPPCKSDSSFTPPDSVESLSSWSFSSNKYLESFTANEGLTVIDTCAFEESVNLKEVVIPGIIDTINSGAFKKCSALEKVTVLAANCDFDETSFDDDFSGTFYGKSTATTTYIYAMSKGFNFVALNTIPVEVELYDSGTYNDSITWELYTDGTLLINGTGEMKTDFLQVGYLKYSGLNPGAEVIIKKAVVSEGITSIGYQAFYHCTKLTEVILPDGIKSIGRMAFQRCDSLQSISLPESITHIYDSAFKECAKLESIKIPSEVTSLQSQLFYDCIRLETIEIGPNVKDVSSDVFTGTKWLKNRRDENPLVVVNTVLVDGKTCSGDVVIPDNVTSLSMYAFADCDAITSISIPSSVESLTSSCFDNCKSLTSINVDNANKNYRSSYGVLYSKDMQTLITYPAGKTGEEFTTPASTTMITYGSFAGNPYLKKITLGDNVSEIGFNALNGLSNLESVTIKNPNCVINPSKGTISNNGETFNGIIYGVEGSTAQTYAEKMGYAFESVVIEDYAKGDVDGNGSIDILDVILLNKSIFGKVTLSDLSKKAADIDGNGMPDSTDSLAIMKYIVELIDSL